MAIDLSERLLERVIPLPKQARIDGIQRIPAHQITIAAESDAPEVRTAVAVLQAALPGVSEGGKAEVELRLVVLPDDAVLTALPNAGQAYRIRPLPAEQGLELAGATALGVLFAARTLAQMALVDGTRIELPQATVLDWPDIAERGQWGGDAAYDLAHTAPLKMNMVEVGVLPNFDEQGKLGLSLMTTLGCEEALAQGVKAVIYVPHLGDLGKYSNIFRFHPDLMSTPDPSEPLPADYKPNICFSKPGAAQLLAGVIQEIIHTISPCGMEVNVWLTEEGKPCFCDQCRGQNAYVLETRLLAAAYALVKQQHPGFNLRILLTQGSYPYNDQILAVVPPDMGVTYYSGTHTYDSSHQPMIYPLLADFAAHGWLGVYPQVDNSWRTVFPFTGPQFMRARMREFAGKRLQSVTGYATPSNTFCAFNVAGLAEWAWNAEGRDEKQFARAWAANQGIADVAKFADWACQIGPLGWDLAGGHFPMRLFWDPARSILEGPTPMAFGQGFLAEIASPEHVERNIALAQQALALAETLGQPECVAESQVVLNSYLFLKALVVLSGKPRGAWDAPLAALDAAAEAAVCGLWVWGTTLFPGLPQRPPHRFEETMSVFSQVVTEAYHLATEAGIVDPRPAWRDQRLGGWTEDNFDGTSAVLRFNVTERLAGAGAYRVMFRHVGGSYGADLLTVALLHEDTSGLHEVCRVEPKAYGYGDNAAPPHVGRYEAWNDVRLDAPAIQPGGRYYIEVTLGGLPAPGEVADKRRTTTGDICLRKAWA